MEQLLYFVFITLLDYILSGALRTYRTRVKIYADVEHLLTAHIFIPFPFSMCYSSIGIFIWIQRWYGKWYKNISYFHGDILYKKIPSQSIKQCHHHFLFKPRSTVCFSSSTLSIIFFANLHVPRWSYLINEVSNWTYITVEIYYYCMWMCKCDFSSLSFHTFLFLCYLADKCSRRSGTVSIMHYHPHRAYFLTCWSSKHFSMYMIISI